MESIKYTTLYKLSSPYHLGDCPILVEAGALLRNENTGRLMIQLKMKNIGEVEIVACKVRFFVNDSFGSEIEAIHGHSYIDLCVKQGESFGSDIPVYVSNENARSFDFSLMEVVFTNREKWQGKDEIWPVLDYAKTVEGYFNDPLVEEQYKLEIGKSNQFVPEIRNALFFCGCGDIRLAKIDKCPVCGRSEAESLLLIKDIDGLRERASVRLQREEEEKQEQERQKEEKKKKREEHILKIKKMIRILTPIAVIVGLLVLITIKVAIPAIERSNAYKSAYGLLEQSQFDEASDAFALLGDYKDSAQMVNECVYRKAASLVEQKEYQEAINLYNSIAEYSDSKDRIHEVEDLWKGDDYQAAIELFEAGDKEKAIKAFKQLGNYKDSEEKVNEITYSLATDKAASKEYEKAISLFEAIPDYKDSKEQVNKSKYLLAKNYFENKDYNKAKSIFTELGAYEDSEKMVLESNYMQAKKCLDEGKYTAAIDLFTTLKDYSDSAKQLIEAKYLYCKNNLELSDSKTKEYLAELTELQYKDAEAMNKQLYKWAVEIIAEVKNHAMEREDILVSAKLIRGPEKAKTKVKFKFSLPNQMLDYCDDVQYTVGSTAECVLTWDILITGYDLLDTPFKISVYDEAGNLIGSYNDVATKWWTD